MLQKYSSQGSAQLQYKEQLYPYFTHDNIILQKEVHNYNI